MAISVTTIAKTRTSAVWVGLWQLQHSAETYTRAGQLVDLTYQVSDSFEIIMTETKYLSL